jgi:hypothetical protein
VSSYKKKGSLVERMNGANSYTCGSSVVSQLVNPNTIYLTMDTDNAHAVTSSSWRPPSFAAADFIRGNQQHHYINNGVGTNNTIPPINMESNVVISSNDGNDNELRRDQHHTSLSMQLTKKSCIKGDIMLLKLITEYKIRTNQLEEKNIKLEEKNEDMEIALRQAVSLIEVNSEKQRQQQDKINHLEQLLERELRHEDKLKNGLRQQQDKIYYLEQLLERQQRQDKLTNDLLEQKKQNLQGKKRRICGDMMKQANLHNLAGQHQQPRTQRQLRFQT